MIVKLTLILIYMLFFNPFYEKQKKTQTPKQEKLTPQDELKLVSLL